MTKYDDYFDTPEWRELRNKKLSEWIQNKEAVNLVLDLFAVAEAIDDAWDRDKEISKERLAQLAFAVFVDIPTNPFMVRNHDLLMPILNNGVHLWLDANRLEENPTDRNLHRSYMLRDIFGLLVYSVIEICRGRNYLRSVSIDVLELFADEEYAEYASKFEQKK